MHNIISTEKSGAGYAKEWKTHTELRSGKPAEAALAANKAYWSQAH
jgi:hypothetical protein